MNPSVAGVLAIALTLAAADVGADRRQDIADRCRALEGRNGRTAVKACIDQDIAAAEALAKYPETAKMTIVRCRTQFKYLGSARIKACTDENLQAKAALSEYPSKYEAVIDGCRIRMGAFGWHLVKACTDSAIGGGKGTE